MKILPFTFLVFLRLQFVISTTNSSSLIYGHWSGNENENYGHSLHNLLGTLSSKTSTGFYNFSITPSKSPNQLLHGLYACRGDVDPQTCRNCVESAKNYILKRSLCSREGLIWYNHCMMRYSNESFFGKWDANSSSSSHSWSWEGRKIKGNRVIFIRILMKTIKDLANEASKVQNMNKYASKVVTIWSNETLYATVQCTPDLSARDCYRCLTHASQKLLLMKGSVKGDVQYTSCMIEYKTTSSFSIYNKVYDDEIGIATLPSYSSIEDINPTALIGVKGANTDDAIDRSK